jgi:hypothetical protein
MPTYEVEVTRVMIEAATILVNAESEQAINQVKLDSFLTVEEWASHSVRLHYQEEINEIDELMDLEDDDDVNILIVVARHR